MDSILIAKIEAPSYSSSGIVKALRNNFTDVYEFNYQNIMFNEGAEEMRRRLMGMVLMNKPDVVFLHIQTPEPLDMNLMEFLSERTYVVLYTFDVRRNIDWYKEYAPYVGLILFGDGESISECRREGITNVDYLQSSADFDLYRPLPDGVDPVNNYGDIVFIGNNFLGSNLKFPNSFQRSEMVEFMKDKFGDQFKVYGLGWSGSRMLNPIEEIEAYRSCKISITQNNFDRTGYTSDRLWRSIGSGAFTISQHFKPFEHYDIPTRALPMWNDFKDLEDYCNFFLKPEWAAHKENIRQEQMMYLKKNSTWNHRIIKLKQLINKHGYAKRMEDIARSAANISQ